MPLHENPIHTLVSPSSGGISPVSWLLRRSRNSRLVRLPNSSGICPLNRFCPSPSDSRLARFPSSGGMFPLSLFPRIPYI